MRHRLKKPCNDCPFRRAALRGWLGAGPPEAFVADALSDYPLPNGNGSIIALPCHQTVNYEDPNWRETLEEVEVCVGGLQFAANNCKDPRDRERSQLVQDAGPNPDVFRTGPEFIDHHRQPGGVRSWED